MEFMYGWIAGIRPLEPGFRKAVIEPKPDIRLERVKCRYDSVQGTYVSNWFIEPDGSVKVHIEIPFNCTAVVRLPEYETAEMELEAGSYDFSYQPKHSFRKPYHGGTTLARLKQDRQAMDILGKYAPAIAGITMSGDPEMGAKSLDDIQKMPWMPFEPAAFAKAIEEICQLEV